MQLAYRQICTASSVLVDYKKPEETAAFTLFFDALYAEERAKIFDWLEKNYVMECTPDQLPSESRKQNSKTLGRMLRISDESTQRIKNLIQEDLKEHEQYRLTVRYASMLQELHLDAENMLRLCKAYDTRPSTAPEGGPAPLPYCFEHTMALIEESTIVQDALAYLEELGTQLYKDGVYSYLRLRNLTPMSIIDYRELKTLSTEGKELRKNLRLDFTAQKKRIVESEAEIAAEKNPKTKAELRYGLELSMAVFTLMVSIAGFHVRLETDREKWERG